MFTFYFKLSRRLTSLKLSSRGTLGWVGTFSTSQKFCSIYKVGPSLFYSHLCELKYMTECVLQPPAFRWDHIAQIHFSQIYGSLFCNVVHLGSVRYLLGGGLVQRGSGKKFFHGPWLKKSQWPSPRPNVFFNGPPPDPIFFFNGPPPSSRSKQKF